MNHQAKAVADYIGSLTIGQDRHAGELVDELPPGRLRGGWLAAIFFG